MGPDRNRIRSRQPGDDARQSVAPVMADMDESAIDPSAMDKSELRSLFRRRRREILPAVAGKILTVALREVPLRVPEGKRLGLYWPLAHEPDLRPLAQLLADQLALPAVNPEHGLHYRPWRPDQPLAPDACGIPAPVDGPPLPPEQLALLLVPALALSADGVRLGSGGGWYDRLRADPRWRAVEALVVLPAACLTAALPGDPWDIPFDSWLDETGIHRVGSHQAIIASP